MYIDWVGDQPELVTDTETDKRIKKVHIFATTLRSTTLIYAEAFQMKLPCFIEGCAHVFHFMVLLRNTLCPITCELPTVMTHKG